MSANDNEKEPGQDCWLTVLVWGQQMRGCVDEDDNRSIGHNFLLYLVCAGGVERIFPETFILLVRSGVVGVWANLAAGFNSCVVERMIRVRFAPLEQKGYLKKKEWMSLRWNPDVLQKQRHLWSSRPAPWPRCLRCGKWWRKRRRCRRDNKSSVLRPRI